MGLLAGEKRKQKLGLDPNNITWAKDTNSVGQSMLKKMGWKEGAGLGANEDGRVVPVKATMKSNTAGLGCSAKHADSWIAHGEEFDQILAALNASTSTTSDNGAESPASGRNSPKEEMEGQRRFYGRYSRGNVKRTRTAEDLNCIFGRRKTQAPTEDVTKSKEEAASEDSSNDSTDDKGVDKSHGVETVISTYSVQDYFAQKMKNLKKKKDEDNSDDKMDPETNKQVDETQDVDSDSQDVEKQDFNSYVTSACSVKDYFSQKLKAKSEKLAIADNEHNCEKENLVSNNDCSNIDEDEAIKEGLVEEESSQLVDVKMKKKKKKKRKTDDDDDVPTLESSPNVDDNVDEEKTEKKKGKKRKCEDVEGQDGDSTSCVEETCVVEKSEKKKKKKRRMEVVEDSVMDSALDTNNGTDETCTEEKTKKKKNKKKRKTEDVEINDDDDSNLDTNNEAIESGCTEETTEKRKKKKKKSKSGK